MNKTLVIVGREWRAYFLSPLAWVILAAFLGLNGYFFWVILNVLNEPGAPKDQTLLYLFNNGLIWWCNLIIISIIGMRLFPEERRSGTIEVLLTSPVTEGQVVLGKFIGALGFFLTLWLPSVVLVWTIRANIGVGAVMASYASVVLVAAYFVAVSTFASTLTKNQILAAVLAFVMLFVIFAAGLLQYVFKDPSNSKLLDYLNIWNHMDEFARGVVDSRRVIYYVSATAFFLFLATASLSAKKETP